MQGRRFVCNKFYKGIGFFEFEELCDRPIGSADYIAIAQNCSTVMLTNVPYFTLDNRNVMRRFITLVKIKIIYNRLMSFIIMVLSYIF
jgi:predicted ATPase